MIWDAGTGVVHQHSSFLSECDAQLARLTLIALTYGLDTRTLTTFNEAWPDVTVRGY